MNLDIYELSAKQILGDQLTDEEKARVREYNTKYALVRWLVMDKRNHQDKSKQLKDFHFTPGDNFLELPVLDIVNSIIDSFSLPTSPLSFGDLNFKKAGSFGDPPHTGKAKKSITE